MTRSRWYGYVQYFAQFWSVSLLTLNGIESACLSGLDWMIRRTLMFSFIDDLVM